MEKKWWHDKVVYELYPKSFKDSNNDGIGDIKGVIEKLDYLKNLGVDIIWLTPFYKSPMEDNGYDVADYKSVNPLFGTMEDMDKLLAEAKKRDMYIMIDIVANHTSNEHHWFKESQKSKDNPYRDYYIWRDEKLYDYQSTFYGSAWKYDEKTKQYYFHEFGEGQPDLNWENPKVLEEMADCINFWMEKGVKGIRFDVIHLLGKEIDNNILSYGPTLHSKIQKLAAESYYKYDILTVGEAWGNLKNAIDFTKPDNKELNLVFQFECTSSTCDFARFGKFSPKKIDHKFIKDTLCKYQHGLNDVSFNSLFVENHDLGRCIDKFGDPKNYYDESAKCIAMYYFCLKGIVFMYQGQELGMTNLHVTDVNDYDDIEIKGAYEQYVLKDKVMTYEEFLVGCNKEGRDNGRTPIQWDDSVNAGFNKGHKPWLKINENYKEINAKKELADENSIYNFYKKLFSLKKSEEYHDVFTYGDFNSYLDDNKNVFVYTRTFENKKILVIANMNEYVENIALNFETKKTLLQNYNKDYASLDNLKLEPYEACVLEIN